MPTQPPLTIAVLGLGAMGGRLAARLLQTDHHVVVFNRTERPARALEARGATFAGSAREAAEQADVTISMVHDDAASRDVWLDKTNGALAALREGSVAIESSTLTPVWARTLGEAVDVRGGRFLDAPVVGSRPHVEAGKLVYLVGGEAATVADVRGFLERLGSAVHHVGPVGAGMAMKLAVNALFGVQAVALAEVLSLLGHAGFDRTSAAEILSAMPTSSPAAARLAGLMAEGAFEPNFPIRLARKDLRYALAATSAEMPVIAAAADVFAEAEREGYGEDDIAGIAQPYSPIARPPALDVHLRPERTSVGGA